MQKNSEDMRKFNYLTSEINALYHKAAVQSCISDSMQIILYCICEVGECCPQSTLYKQSGVSRKTINSAVRRLESDGLVYTEKAGGHSTVVRLTEKGKAVCQGKDRAAVQSRK